MIRVAVNGILGRMGQFMVKAILAEESLVLVGGIDTLETFQSEEIFVSTDPAEILPEADVVVDFSSPAGLASITKACHKHAVPLITGTTGIDKNHSRQIRQLAKKVAVVQSFNFSLGINLFLNILAKTAALLGEEFDAEIVEVHHRGKADFPSGTALTLAKTLASARGIDPKKSIVVGRNAESSGRGKEINVHSVRGGSVVGEHQVHLLGACESICLTHQALSRRAFVEGVLRAIYWIGSKEPGYYTMQDVLSIN